MQCQEHNVVVASKHDLLVNKLGYAEDASSNGSTSDEAVPYLPADLLDASSSDDSADEHEMRGTVDTSTHAKALQTCARTSTAKKGVQFNEVVAVVRLGSFKPCGACEPILASRELTVTLARPLTDDRMLEIEDQWWKMKPDSNPTDGFAVDADGKPYSGPEIELLYTSEPTFPVVFTLRGDVELRSPDVHGSSTFMATTFTDEALCKTERDTRGRCSRAEPNTCADQDARRMIVWPESFDADEPEVLQQMVDSGVYDIPQLSFRYELSRMQQRAIQTYHEDADTSRAAYLRQYESQLVPILERKLAAGY